MKDKNDLTAIPIQSNFNLFVKLGDSGRGWGYGGVFLPVTQVRGHPKAFLDQEHYYNLGENWLNFLFYRWSVYLVYVCSVSAIIELNLHVDFAPVVKPICLPPWENIDQSFSEGLGKTFKVSCLELLIFDNDTLERMTLLLWPNYEVSFIEF